MPLTDFWENRLCAVVHLYKSPGVVAIHTHSFHFHQLTRVKMAFLPR